jgi:hypothetical protein
MTADIVNVELYAVPRVSRQVHSNTPYHRGGTTLCDYGFSAFTTAYVKRDDGNRP